MLDTLLREVEEFAIAVYDGFDLMGEVIKETTELAIADIETYLEDYFTTEIEPSLQAWVDPMLELFRLEVNFSSDDFTPFPPLESIEAALKHPVCVGCRHYHGMAYGGQELVCGMHPYGWEGESCPDWESN